MPNPTQTITEKFVTSLIVCEHSHDNLELGVVPALEPAMLSHSYSLAKPLSSRCVAC